MSVKIFTLRKCLVILFLVTGLEFPQCYKDISVYLVQDITD